MEIQFQGVFTKDHLLKVNKLILANRLKKRILRFAIALSLLVAGNFAIMYGTESKYGWIYFAAFGMSIIYATLLFRWPYSITNRQWTRNKQLYRDYHGVITEEHIWRSANQTETKSAWGSYVDYRISKDFILLYQSDQITNPFMREFFANHTDWQQFVTLVKKKLPEKK